ncbi:MAG: hypothetical protein JXB88_26115 [Spirochaetales bacterium]|nr:hypothetical protein [Spirochaetales bacterium]
MSKRRPYIAQGTINSGTGVVQGATETQVKAPGSGGSGDYIGVYAFEANNPKEDGDRVGIVIYGPCKVLAGGTVTAGKKAVFKSDTTGSFVNCPTTEGQYELCGKFLQSGVDGEYVDMLVMHGSITIPGT